jgi:5-methylcytosine-specific restriction endonuclease McrA
MNMNYGWRREIRYCPKGHEYNEENTYVSKAGERSCKVCARARYEANKAEVKARSLQWKKDNPERRRAQEARSREKHRERYRDGARKSAKRKRNRLKKDALAAYGNQCVWCGQPNLDYLEFDHIKGDGKEHREQMSSPAETYKWMRDNNYPKDRFQILCGNCHNAKSYHGAAPPPPLGSALQYI